MADPDPTTDPTLDVQPPSNAEDAPTAAFSDPTVRVHEVVAGRYTLLEKIGEGGMGAVYRARQSEPVRREVAIKIILPGMDSKQVLARFEVERQALAMLDHPNIARVLDAGTTGNGQPFFAMELINGAPITQFCNERKASVRTRLDLFVQVCHAIQHAHHKGIIHRDIKPTNVLVALYDDAPVPKVIDFGVAKPTSQQLTDRSMFTQYGALVGTLEYMSPEQAQFHAIDVDTRTDVYSLGVLLYELLTGATPFEKKRLRSAAFDEVLRIIREEEPQTPSRRLSTIEGIASIAAERSLEPKRLGAVVRGELDWIVMKCLEKERSRRYDTANALAADVQRYLNDEPIAAGPPRTSYRLQKFLRRHRGPVFAAALLGVAIVTGTVASVSLAVRAIAAEKLAKANEKTAVQEREAAIKASEGERKAREVAERFAVKAVVENDLKQMVDDPAVGLLRLASTLDSIPPHLHDFRDIAVANILAWGQELCPLPALEHDGYDPVEAQLNDAGTLVLTRGVDPTLRLWDPISGTQKATLTQPAPADFASFTSDGRSVVSFDNTERTVRVWNADDGRRRFTSPANRGEIRAVAFSRDGSRVATLGDLEGIYGDIGRELTGVIQVFDAKANRRLGQAFADPETTSVFVMDPHGRFLVTIAGDRSLRVLSISERVVSQDVSRPRGTVDGAFLSPSGRRFALLVSNGERRIVVCWETERWTQIGQQELTAAVDSGGWIDDATLALKNSARGLSETVLFESAPKTVRRLFAIQRSGDLILGENGEVYDSRLGVLPSPRGRRYHPSALELAVKQRWLGRKPVVDFATELDLGGDGLETQAVVQFSDAPLFVGLDLKSLKRTLCRNITGSIPQSFVHLTPLPPFSGNDELFVSYCRLLACGTLGANGKLLPDSRADWERLRLQLSQKLEAAKPRLSTPVSRVLFAVCRDEAYWVRRRIPTADAASLDGLWSELLRLEPSWKNHLEWAFFKASPNQRSGRERLEHLRVAWQRGGSQYFDVVFNPLVEAISETVSAEADDSKAIASAEAALRQLLEEIKGGKRRIRLVPIAAMNAVRRKDLDEAMKYTAEYERFVLKDGRRTIVDAFRKFEREQRGRTWDDYLATKQRACIARCLTCMVACLKKDRSAAQAALREADVLRKDLLDRARPEELRFQDSFDYAERLLREMKG